jgi:hypothetical protein
MSRVSEMAEIERIDDIFYDQEEGEGEGDRSQGRCPFEPITDADIKAARLRDLNKSVNDMENDTNPEFNSNLPYFNQNDRSSINELKEFNKILVDKMYTAYNENADELLLPNFINITTNREGLNKLENDREEDLK